MSPGNPFMLWSEGQRSRSRVTKTLTAWVFALLWFLASSNSTLYPAAIFLLLARHMHMVYLRYEMSVTLRSCESRKGRIGNIMLHMVEYFNVLDLKAHSDIPTASSGIFISKICGSSNSKQQDKSFFSCLDRRIDSFNELLLVRPMLVKFPYKDSYFTVQISCFLLLD